MTVFIISYFTNYILLKKGNSTIYLLVIWRFIHLIYSASLIVLAWCSSYHYCTTSFNKVWTQVSLKVPGTLEICENLWEPWSRLEIKIKAIHRSTIPLLILAHYIIRPDDLWELRNAAGPQRDMDIQLLSWPAITLYHSQLPLSFEVWINCKFLEILLLKMFRKLTKVELTSNSG